MHVLEALVGLAGSRWKLRKTDTINRAQEAKKTTSKHEFVYLQNIGVLREWLKNKNVHGEHPRATCVDAPGAVALVRSGYRARGDARNVDRSLE